MQQNLLLRNNTKTSIFVAVVKHYRCHVIAHSLSMYEVWAVALRSDTHVKETIRGRSDSVVRTPKAAQELSWQAEVTHINTVYTQR